MIWVSSICCDREYIVMPLLCERGHSCKAAVSACVRTTTELREVVTPYEELPFFWTTIIARLLQLIFMSGSCRRYFSIRLSSLGDRYVFTYHWHHASLLCTLFAGLLGQCASAPEMGSGFLGPYNPIGDHTLTKLLCDAGKCWLCISHATFPSAIVSGDLSVYVISFSFERQRINDARHRGKWTGRLTEWTHRSTWWCATNIGVMNFSWTERWSTSGAKQFHGQDIAISFSIGERTGVLLPSGNFISGTRDFQNAVIGLLLVISKAI